MSTDDAPPRRSGRKPVLLAAGAALAAGLAGLYVRRILRGRARPAPDVRFPTAGRPLARVRGELDARAPTRDDEE